MGHSQAASWKQFLLYQSQLVFAVSLTKRLKKNSGLRAHKAEIVFREGCQPKEPLAFPRCGDTTTRRAHDLGHGHPKELYRLPNWSILLEPDMRVIFCRQ